MPDAVAALGGPEAYAAAYAAAGPGRDELFREAFEGSRPEATRKPRRVVGKHTARAADEAKPVIEPESGDETPGRDEMPPGGQRSLFS